MKNFIKKLLLGKKVCKLILFLHQNNCAFPTIVRSCGFDPTRALKVIKKALKYDVIDVKKIANRKIYQLSWRGEEFYKYLTK